MRYWPWRGCKGRVKETSAETEPGTHMCTHPSLAFTSEATKVGGNQGGAKTSQEKRGRGLVKSKGHTSWESSEFLSLMNRSQILDFIPWDQE